MINASGTNPNKYANGISGILNKVKKEKGDTKDETAEINLTDYVGYYNLQPWWSEIYFSSWEGKLVSLSLPTDDPADNMTFYKQVEGDVFRRIRDDDTLGETLEFKRDENGKVVKAVRFDNDYMKRIR